jgi:hypothetical protein
LPVARTLWTLYPPPGMQADADAAASAGALAVAMARLRNTAGVIAQTAGSSALEEAQRTVWYRQWAARLTADYRLVQRGLAEQGRLRNVSTERAALRGINDEQTALADRLGLLTILGDVSAAERGPRRPTDMLRGAALEEGRQPICFESAASLSAVTVQLRPADVPSRAGRWLLAAAAAALAVALCVPWSRKRTRRATSYAAWWAKRYPHTVGVLLGVAWLLWLSPIAIGWCILFGSLAAILWRAAPRRPSAVRM